MQPFLKWAGGKRQLISQIEPYVQIGEGTYFEPFLGAGAILFHFQPQKAIVNDINNELYNVYSVVKNRFGDLVEELIKHKENNDSDYFYKIRALDRTEEYGDLSDVEKAARFIYLNKTCFNGLYRVNSKGQFNVPYGKYKNPDILNEKVLEDVHKYFNNKNITLLNGDFETAVKDAKEGDFVYFDPPYDPLSETSSFTSYAQEGFGRNEQFRLRDTFKELNDRGVKVLLSNSDTPFIRDIYHEFTDKIITVQASRAINAKASGRGKINEVLIVGDHIDFDQEIQSIQKK
ncbi:DNA adenine methylase [Gottfriedia acidiceleris]|uniref:DNA adenine methylase n=1 Tax=Gottfriedia acidiceleris TaxID=371036 RepID=UPI002FFE0CF5